MRAKRITKLIQAVDSNAIVRFEGGSFFVYLPQDVSVETRRTIERLVKSLSTVDEEVYGGGWWEATIPNVSGNSGVLDSRVRSQKLLNGGQPLGYTSGFLFGLEDVSRCYRLSGILGG